MENVLKKVSSRKFIVAVSGVVSGIVLVVNGSTTEGVTAIVTSVVAYLAAEGLVDMAAVKKTVAQAESVADKMDDEDVGGMTD